MNRNLLYVDDQPENLVVFRAAFEDEFSIYEALSGAEALRLLDEHEIALLVADQRMPDMTGVELCEIVRRNHPYTVRMILTGYSDTDAMIDAINKGHVYGFTTKPWNREALRTTLLRGFEARDLMVTNNALLERLEHAERCAALGQCAARVAHELRNQLLVLPLLELIETRYGDRDDLRELAAIVRQSHDGLMELLDELKEFARKDNEEFRKIPVSLAQVAREAVSLAGMHESVPRRALKLVVEAEPIVRCHPSRIQQVVFNLTRNAADAVRGRPDPEIVVTVGDGEGPEPSPHARLTVRDNGPGIDPAIQDRIGEPHFTTKGRDGNGLGLDICKRIVAAHQGVLRWESQPQRGATFVVQLPKWTGSQAGTGSDRYVTR